MNEYDISNLLNAIENDTVTPPTIVVTPKEVEENSDSQIMSWIQGKTPMPSQIKSFSDDANNRLNWAILLNIVTQFKRVNRLLEFIDKAENKLLSVDVDKVPNSDLLKLYDNASNKVADLLELSRKFSLQNKELLKGSTLTEAQQMLVDSIKSLSQEDIEKLKAKISEL